MTEQKPVMSHQDALLTAAASLAAGAATNEDLSPEDVKTLAESAFGLTQAAVQIAMIRKTEFEVLHADRQLKVQEAQIELQKAVSERGNVTPFPPRPVS